MTLMRSVAILQHHDAITGTEKQHVAKDYVRRLRKGLQEVAQAVLKDYGLSMVWYGQFGIIGLRNDIQGTDNNYLAVYNGQSHPNGDFIRLPTPNGLEWLIQSGNQTIDVTLIPNNPSYFHPKLHQHQDTQEGDFKFHSVFYTETVPPLTLKFFKLKPMKSTKIATTTARVMPKFKSISEMQIPKFLPEGLSIQMGYFEGHQNEWTLGINTEPISGAYLFNPEKVVQLPIKESKIFRSNGWMELHVIYQNDWWGYIVRKHAKMSHLEIEWFVNPINVTDRHGKEVFITYRLASCQNKGIFYTDSNGLEMVRRNRGQREELVSASFYPVTTSIFIQDNQTDLSVLTDRSQGGTSLEDGEITLMIHRRLLQDDGLGVSEPLDDKTLAVGRHQLLISNNKKKNNIQRINSKIWRRKQALNNFRPLLTFTTNSTFASMPQFGFQFSHVNLPKYVEMISLDQWKNNGEIMLRLQNIIDDNNNPNDNNDTDTNLVLPDIKTILQPNRFNKCQEVNLVGQPLKQNNTTTIMGQKQTNLVSCVNITLQPLEIKTFILSW